MALHERHEQALRTYAEELGLDPELAVAVGSQESGSLGSAAVSPKGARGVMQVMPETSKELRPKYGADTRKQGVGYLRDLHEEFSDVPEDQKQNFALAAYNAGPTAVRKAQKLAEGEGLDPNNFDDVASFLPEETKSYVPQVTGRLSPTPQPEGEGKSAEDMIAELEQEEAAEQEATPEAGSEATPEGRGLARSVYERTVGRTSRAADIALGGLPSALAGAAGAASAGDTAGVQQALEAGGGTKERLLNVGLGLLELGLTGKMPGAAAVTGAGAGAVEAATGSEEAGTAAELLIGVAPAVRGLARATGRGFRGLTGTPTTEQLATAGLGAEKTAKEVGEALQQPRQGVRGAITRTARTRKGMYQAVTDLARSNALEVPTVKSAKIGQSIRNLTSIAKKEGHPLSGDNRRALAVIQRLGRGAQSSILDPTGKPLRGAAKPIPVADLIDAQSTLRRSIYKLAKDDRNRGLLIKLSRRIDDALLDASKGVPEVEQKLREAQEFYRTTEIPTRRTLARAAGAEEPETATRVLTQAKKPTRFERFAAAATQEETEAVRSAFFNDLVEGSMEQGKLSVQALSSKLGKAEASGQLKLMANTKARKNTIRALQRVAETQTAGRAIPVIGGGVGYTGAAGSLVGAGAGFTIGRLIKVGLESEPASRALLRLASMKQAGTPGWKLAMRALRREVVKAAPAARAAVGEARESEGESE